MNSKEEGVAPISVFTFLFFAVSLLLGGISLLYPTAFIFSILFGWLGFIQLLNRAALYFPRPLGRVVHWVHAMTFECLALVGLLFSHLIRYKQTAKRSSGRPILLVHGYLNYGAVWAFQRKVLQAFGLGPIYTINLGYPFHSIEKYAEKVKKKAEQIAQETQRNDLILIGHSMGGLVSSWFATRIAVPGKVTDVITIGSPLAGTPMASIAYGLNAREMRPNSKLVKEIQKDIANSRQTRFYHIATKSDQIVIPGISAVTGNHLQREFVLEDIGHVSLLFSQRVSRTIFRWLTNRSSIADD